MKPHVHAEIIKAWADGAVIQVYDTVRKEWIDYSSRLITPWVIAAKYRVKPEQIVCLSSVSYSPIYGPSFENALPERTVANVRFTFEETRLVKVELIR